MNEREEEQCFLWRRELSELCRTARVLLTDRHIILFESFVLLLLCSSYRQVLTKQLK